MEQVAGVAALPLVPAPYLLLADLVEEDLLLLLVELSQQVRLDEHLLQDLLHHLGLEGRTWPVVSDGQTHTEKREKRGADRQTDRKTQITLD